jgi:hypothetical protein
MLSSRHCEPDLLGCQIRGQESRSKSPHRHAGHRILLSRQAAEQSGTFSGSEPGRLFRDRFELRPHGFKRSPDPVFQADLGLPPEAINSAHVKKLLRSSILP